MKKDAKAKKVKPAVKGSSRPDDGKVSAILSYFGLLGFAISLILNNGKNSPFAKFHMRQSIMIMIFSLSLVVVMFIPFIGMLLFIPFFIFFIVIWIIGLVAAINGKEQQIPLIGSYAQEWFKGL